MIAADILTLSLTVLTKYQSLWSTTVSPKSLKTVCLVHYNKMMEVSGGIGLGIQSLNLVKL